MRFQYWLMCGSLWLMIAATFVTTAVAIPLLLLAAAIETWITPDILRWVYHHSYTF